MMQTYAWYDQNGDVLLIGDCEPGAEHTMPGDYAGVVQVHGNRPTPDDVYVDGGSLRQKPVRPSPFHAWRNKCWVPELDKAKAARRKEINAARDLAKSSVFAFAGKTFDADPASISSLMLAVQAGVPVVWRCADNSDLALTSDMLAAIPAAIASHNQSQHDKAVMLKRHIDGADTIEQVLQVEW